jgi:hypothetical protein
MNLKHNYLLGGGGAPHDVLVQVFFSLYFTVPPLLFAANLYRVLTEQNLFSLDMHFKPMSMEIICTKTTWINLDQLEN